MRISISITAITIAALLMGPGAFAESPRSSQDVSEPASVSAPGRLEEVIVTAQRREENQQRAAVAISVVSGADLAAAGITQVDRLGERAPALTVEHTSTGNILFVRGVGNFTLTANSDPAIAFNYDGVYVARSTSTNGVFFDLERVEVLKGPQGTLYGRNATGGAINVIPTQPRLGEWSGFATASYGNYGAATVESAVNAPLGDKAALRISGSVSDHEGYLDDGSSDDKTRSARVQVKAALTPSLTVRLAGDYSHSGGIGSGVSYIGNYAFNPAAQAYSFIPSGLPISTGQYTADAQAYRQTVRGGTAGRPLDALTPSPFQDNKFYGVTGEVNWETEMGTLTVIPAWRDSNLDYLAVPAFLYSNRENDKQFSLEARFQGKQIGVFDYTIGGYYFHETINLQTQLSLSSAAAFLDSDYKTKSFAPFLRLTAHLNDALRLVGGVRYTDDKKTFQGPTTSGAVVCLAPACPNAPLFPLVENPSQIPFAFPPPGVPVVPIFVNGAPTGAIAARTDRADNSELASADFTYRAAVEYDLAPESLLYASLETGYRSGGFSPAAGFETFQPEYITAYTLGTKNRFFDDRVQLNVEAFYWKYRDQQVNHVGLDLNGRTANFTQNIGHSKIQGVEVESRFLLTPTTLLSASVQYLDAKNEEFKYQAAVGTPGTPPPLTGCAVSLSANPTLYDVDCAGLPSYNSPKWTLTPALQQTFELGDFKLIAAADSQYKSERNIGFQYLAQQKNAANWQSNAQISFSSFRDKWLIAAFVRNIENERIPVFSAVHPTANILINGTTAPRTYGLRATVKF